MLAKCYADDPNLGTLLSRTDAALKLDQHRRNKADERALMQKGHRQKLARAIIKATDAFFASAQPTVAKAAGAASN